MNKRLIKYIIVGVAGVTLAFLVCLYTGIAVYKKRNLEVQRLPYLSSCSTITELNRLCMDSDDNELYIGTGTGFRQPMSNDYIPNLRTGRDNIVAVEYKGVIFARDINEDNVKADAPVEDIIKAKFSDCSKIMHRGELITIKCKDSRVWTR